MSDSQGAYLARFQAVAFSAREQSKAQDSENSLVLELENTGTEEERDASKDRLASDCASIALST